MNVDIRGLSLNSKLNASHNSELAWFERDDGRCSGCEIFRIDADLVRNSWLEVVKLEVSASGGQDGAHRYQHPSAQRSSLGPGRRLRRSP